MALRIGDDAPDFTAETTEGPIDFHDWIGDGWAILFSHPKDFTPVCTTELGYMAGLKAEFDKRNCKVLGLSVDGVSDHHAWSRDIEETQGHAVNYPLIGDPELKIATLYEMLPAGAGTTSQGRTAVDNLTVRTVFLVGPDKKIKLSLTYPMSTGRNFDEVLRVLDSCQLTAKHKVATPVNWKQGEDVIIVPAVSDEEARKAYPGGWKAPKPYLRIVPQPSDAAQRIGHPPPPAILRAEAADRASDRVAGASRYAVLDRERRERRPHLPESNGEGLGPGLGARAVADQVLAQLDLDMGQAAPLAVHRDRIVGRPYDGVGLVVADGESGA